MGVGAHILDPKGWKKRNKPDICVLAYNHRLGIRNQPDYLGRRGCEALGISLSFMKQLADMNDNGTPFKEIAAAIKAYIDEKVKLK